MRLGNKTRDLLELMGAFGLDVVEATFTLPILYKSLKFSNERNFYDTAKRLHSAGLIDLSGSSRKREDWVGKLTQKGKSVLNDKIDPVLLWNERWDRKWRLISFDLPRDAWLERGALRKWLKHYRFGCLQGSVWISPRNLGDWSSELSKLKIEPTKVTFMIGKFGGERTTAEYVLQAWDFGQLNKDYETYLEFLSRNSVGPKSNTPFEDWYRVEMTLWRNCFSNDPFLPQDLLLSGTRFNYLGMNAFEERKKAYSAWKQILLR